MSRELSRSSRFGVSLVAIGIALVSSLAFSDSGGAAGRPSAKAGIASAPVGPELVSVSGPAESDGRISQHWQLENVVPNSTVTVTYVDQRTNSIIDRTVDGTAFVPESAVDLGLVDTFIWEDSVSDGQEEYGFASWVEVGNCAYWDYLERCRTVSGPFFDPGVATSLTEDIVLAAVYGPAKAIPLLCQGKSSGDVGHHATVHSYQFKLTQLPSVRDPLPSSPDEPGGCGVSPGVHYSDWVARRSTIPADIDGNVLRPGWRDSLIANSNDVAVTFVLDPEGATAGGVNVALFTTRVLAAGETVTSWDGRTFGEGSYVWTQGWNQTNFVAITHDLRKDGYNYWAARLSFAHSPETYLNAFITDYQQSLVTAGFDWSTFPTEVIIGITTSYGTSFRIGYDANSPTADDPTGSPLGEYTEYGIHDDREISNVATCVQLSRNVPTLTGYTFVGWNTAADGSGTSYSAGASFCRSAAVAGNNTLYAQWSTDVYDVVFSVNLAGDSSYQTALTSQMSLNQTIVLPGLPDDTWERDGYVFDGWTSGGTDYAPGSTFTLESAPTNSVQFYSKWAAESQEVNFLPNKGTGSTVPDTGTFPDRVQALSNQSVTLPDGPSRVGYDFAGWNEQADGSGTTYVPGVDPYNVGISSSTLYAQWTPKQYDVIWYESDGETPKANSAPDRAPGSIIYNSGTEGFFDTNLDLPSSYNSEYPGDVSSLNTAQDGSGLTFEAGSTLPINEDTIPETGNVITLYQQVTWPVQYQFWCETDCGSQLVKYHTQYVREEVSATVASADVNLFELEGWTFAGWDATSDGEDVLYGFQESFDFVTPFVDRSTNPVVTFKGVYQPKTQIAKFDSQGGSDVPVVFFPAWKIVGDSTDAPTSADRDNRDDSAGVVLPEAPTRDGFEFKEWNTEQDGSGTGAEPGVTIHPSFFHDSMDFTAFNRFGDITMYGIWKDTQTLTYDGPTEFELLSPDATSYSNGIDLVDWDSGGDHLLRIRSSAGLDVALTIDSSSESVCSLTEFASDYDGVSFRSGWRVQFSSTGECIINASQSGTSSVVAAADMSFSIDVLGVAQTISFGAPGLHSDGVFVTLSHTYGQYDNQMRFEYPDVKPVIESLTSDVCGAAFANSNGDSMIVTNEGGGDCRVKVSQDGKDINGDSTLFQPTEAIFETFFKYTQNPQVNNSGVIPFIADDVDSFELDITVADGLQENVDWYAVEVDSEWSALPNADFTGPADSTTCVVGDDEATVTILSTGQCGVFGEIPGNDEYEDWSTPLDGGATARYVIKDGFYIGLDVGEGTLEGGQRVLAADGMSVSLPAPSRDGYRFAGWNTSPDGSGTNYVIGDQTWSGTVAATLYAQWEVRAPILATDTSEPHAEVGRANYVFPDGSKSQTPLEVLSPTAIRAGADEFEMDLEGNEDGAAEIDEVRQTLVFRTGKEGIATGRGFQPGSIAEIWLFSTPVFLGETTVLEDGTFAKTFDVPEDIELGEHVIQAEGISAAGEPKAIAAGVIVAGANPASPDDGSGDGAGTGSGDDVVAGDGSSDGAGTGSGGDVVAGDGSGDGADAGAGAGASTTVPPGNATLPATGAALSTLMSLMLLTLAAGCCAIVIGARRRSST